MYLCDGVSIPNNFDACSLASITTKFLVKLLPALMYWGRDQNLHQWPTNESGTGNLEWTVSCVAHQLGMCKSNDRMLTPSSGHTLVGYPWQQQLH
eukprot:752224-Hanusia_phi.AAC.6